MLLILLALGLLLACGGWLAWRTASRALQVHDAPPVVAASVWTASAHKHDTVAKAIEDAMAAAVADCVAQGVSLDDTATVAAAMQAARARVLGR